MKNWFRCLNNFGACGFLAIVDDICCCRCCGGGDTEPRPLVAFAHLRTPFPVHLYLSPAPGPMPPPRSVHRASGDATDTGVAGGAGGNWRASASAVCAHLASGLVAGDALSPRRHR